MRNRWGAALAALLAAAVVGGLASPAQAQETFFLRWALNSTTYSHLGNPLLGQARHDSWVGEKTDFDTVEQAQAVSRVVKLSKAVRVQADVVRLETADGQIIARNATPVNSGTASTATQSTVFTDVGFEFECPDPQPLRVRAQFSIRWTDGRLSVVSELGPLSEVDFCVPDPSPLGAPTATRPSGARQHP